MSSLPLRGSPEPARRLAPTQMIPSPPALAIMAPDTMGAGKPDKRGTLVEPSGARLVSLLAPDQDDGALLLQPVVGLTRPGDIDRFTCTRTHRTVVDKYHDRDRTIREKAYPAPE